jgi:5-methylcytosine-specific restriction endonuclease McrA
MDSIISQQEAKSLGLPTYFDGEFCYENHLSEKFTSTGKCVECSNKYTQHLSDNLSPVKLAKLARRAARKQRRGRRVESFMDNDEAHLKYINLCLNVQKQRPWRQETQEQVTPQDVLDIFKSQNGECPVCFVKFIHVGYEIEHKTPLAAYGSNRKDNIQLLCTSCNRSKKDKQYEDWLSNVRTEQVLQYLEHLAEEGY